jgi:hypothetical protein
MVKLKSSFDKSWGGINEKCNNGYEWNSLGKTGAGKCDLLSQKISFTQTHLFHSFSSSETIILVTAPSSRTL